jgi:hypothetical protein
MPSNSKSGENSRENDIKTSESGMKKNTSNRGFASMDEAKQREIASKGGKASHGGGRTPGSGKGGNKTK